MRGIKVLLVASLLGVSAFANALSVSQDMDILGVNLVTVQHSNDAKQMHQALEKMRIAAQDAEKQTPYTMQGQAADSATLKAYRAGIQQLITQIDVVDKLALANKLPQAKVEARKLIDIRNQNHSKFR